LCCVASFFQAAANYDSVIETDGFPPTVEDIWILGSAYKLSNGKIQLIKLYYFVTSAFIVNFNYNYDIATYSLKIDQNNSCIRNSVTRACEFFEYFLSSFDVLKLIVGQVLIFATLSSVPVHRTV